MKTELQNMLIGENAFYNQKNYEKIFKKEIESIKLPDPIYTYGRKNNFLIGILKVLKVVFSIIIFPVGLYLLIHILLGKIIVNESMSSSLRTEKGREGLADKIKFSDFKIKRVNFGKNIDGLIAGKPETFGNGRWTIEHMGSDTSYEKYLKGHNFIQKFLNKYESNLILFNNPGVGCSEGPFTRWFARDVYRGIVRFVVEKIEAKEIIHRTTSLGGMLEADALKGYNFKDKVKHICIKIQTAKSMGMATKSVFYNDFLGGIAKFFVWFFGWNIDVVAASKKLKCKEIIIQTATRNMDGSMKKVLGDGTFSKESSLAHSLRNKKYKGTKYFIPTDKTHCNWASDLKAQNKFFEVMDKILLKSAAEIKEAV